ncbi:MAG: hypothetical protein IKF91_01790 [Bacilli bacterium]|nr:hypothetical protein [Bacilli bacterium]
MSINLWDIKNSGYSYYYDISSFIYAIKRGELQYDFSLKSKYICGEEINNPLEQTALQDKYDIIYTDKTHPVCLSTFESYIDKDFFEKYKEIIINEIRQKIIKETPYNIIIINKYLLTTNLLKQIIKKYNGQRIIIKDASLTNEQIKLLKKNHIYADEIINGRKKSISSNKAYSFYTFDDLEKSRNIVINSQIKNKEIDNFKGIDNLIITIDNIEEYEEEYFKKIIKILDRFEQLNTKLTIRIECKKRSNFDKYIQKINCKNINLLINNDYYDYPLNEFIHEEKLLYSMVKKINNSSCTPFEKYISVYNIVKNYKPYKEVEKNENSDLSRDIRYILKNEYMVCVGYSKLFRELLDKVGIESTIYNTSVDTSYDNGFTLENKPINFCKHARVIVNIIDKEYGINGFYISDPTWDNDKNIDKYSNMIMPFDYMQKSKRLFKLEEIDYILDVHSIKEFNDKTKILFNKKIKQKMKKTNYTKKKYKNTIKDTCYEIISLIIQTIKKIDYEKYKEINEIWDKLLYKEEDYESLINNYNFFIQYIGAYIVKKSNNELRKNTIIKGITLSKIKTGNIFPEELNYFICALFEEYDIQDNISRPYNFPNNYLSEDDDGIKIEKKIL